MAVTFELFKEARGQFRFHIKAGHGEIIATSQAYESEASAKAAIESDEQPAALAGQTARG